MPSVLLNKIKNISPTVQRTLRRANFDTKNSNPTTPKKSDENHPLGQTFYISRNNIGSDNQ